MLHLTATDAARDALRRLRADSPGLFEAVSGWIKDVRRGAASAVRSSSSFRLNDGTTARARAFYDFEKKCDLVVVWKLERTDDDGDAMKVFAVEHAP